MRARMRTVATGMVALLLVVLFAGGAAASCAPDDRSLDEQLAEVPIVFVGTVLDTRHGTTASFRVEEVWQGDLPEDVTVLGGPDQAGAATSVDRSWVVGQTYLVVPRAQDGALHDDSCTPTRAWTEDLAEARPASAHAPVPTPAADTTSQGLLLGIAGLVLVVAVGTAVVVLRPRRDDA